MDNKTIYSKDNRIYKLCKELAAKKYRDRLGKYIIEGDNLIVEAIKSGAVMEYLIFREDCKREVEVPGSGILGNPAVRMSAQLFDRISQTETSQGVLAVVSKIRWSPEEFFRQAADGNIAVLDRLQDPGNIGTIMRTAEAAGYKGIVTVKGTVDIYSPKAVRAAAGAVFRMPVLQGDSASHVAGLIKKNGKKLVASCFDAEILYYEADLKHNTAIIIGNEGNGISGELAELADIKVRIPMEGNVESLNAAVAAGLLMYESARREN